MEKKYREVSSERNPDNARAMRKVLAAIVLEEVGGASTMEVVAVGTGTKCISRRTWVHEMTVNDCHGEVIAQASIPELPLSSVRSLFRMERILYFNLIPLVKSTCSKLIFHFICILALHLVVMLELLCPLNGKNREIVTTGELTGGS